MEQDCSTQAPAELLKKQGFAPETVVIDGLASYKAAMRELGCRDRQVHPPLYEPAPSSLIANGGR